MDCMQLDFSALHWAAFAGHEDVVKALTEGGADKEATAGVGTIGS